MAQSLQLSKQHWKISQVVVQQFSILSRQEPSSGASGTVAVAAASAGPLIDEGCLVTNWSIFA